MREQPIFSVVWLRQPPWFLRKGVSTTSLSTAFTTNIDTSLLPSFRPCGITIRLGVGGKNLELLQGKRYSPLPPRHNFSPSSLRPRSRTSFSHPGPPPSNHSVPSSGKLHIFISSNLVCFCDLCCFRCGPQQIASCRQTLPPSSISLHHSHVARQIYFRGSRLPTYQQCFR